MKSNLCSNFPFNAPGARLAQGRPLPQLDYNAAVADDDGDEGEDELGDVSEASVYKLVSLFPGFLTYNRVGGGIFKQLHDQSIAENIFTLLQDVLYYIKKFCLARD